MGKAGKKSSKPKGKQRKTAPVPQVPQVDHRREFDQLLDDAIFGVKKHPQKPR